MKRRFLLSLVTFAAVACTRDTPLQPPVPPSDPPPTGSNQAPKAVLRVTWQGVEGEASAGFSAEGSSDPDADSLYFTWSWGDGTSITGTNRQQQHSYWDNGTYTVVLTVTDTHGATATATTQVTIQNVAPWIRTARLTAPGMPETVPMTATAHIEVQDPGPADDPRVMIDWGDGSSSADTVHVYTIPGAYHVTATVTDKDGASSSRSLEGAVWVYDPGQVPVIPGYEVFDLGTLGGPDAMPAAFNDRAEVVGSSTLASGKLHAFLWRDGVMTDLSPAGEDVQVAGRINDAGWIAGERGGQYGNPDGRMPLWKDGVFTGFASVPLSENGPSPVKISETGDVLLNINKHEYPTAVLLRGGTATAIGSFFAPSFGHSVASDMNARGQVVGSGAYQVWGAGNLDFRAFLWQDDTLTMLASLGTAPCPDSPEKQCAASKALDINEAGQIVGAAYDGTRQRAVLWDAQSHRPTDLGFGSGSSRAVAINERGQITGDAGSGGNEGYFRENGQVMTLGSLGGGGTVVVAMNEDGVVVGTSKTAAGEVHAFVWSRATGMRDLGAGPFGGRGVGSMVVSINARGDILGYASPLDQWGRVSFGQIRAVLWRRVN